MTSLVDHLPDYNKESRIINIDLGSHRGSFLQDISQFFGIRRFPYHHDRNKVLLANQVTLYRLSLHGSKGYKNCILQYHMRNDDLYSIAISKSEDSGRTFSTPMEMHPRETGEMLPRLIIAGSKSIGFDFAYGGDWKAYDGLNYDMVVNAFKKVVSLIDVVPLLDASEAKDLSFNAPLLLMLVSESMRNTIVAYVCNKILNYNYVVKSMQSELVLDYFWRWDDYSGESRFYSEGAVLTDKGMLSLEMHDMRYFLSAEGNRELRIACHIILTMKCLKSKDFTSDGRVKFIHEKKKLTKIKRKLLAVNNGLPNKGLPLMIGKVQGFKLKIKKQPPKYSRNIVDAGMFMGRSFAVSWGPNNLLLHCGYTVSSTDQEPELSSLITREKVAWDNVVRDEDNISKDLNTLYFDSLLKYHKEISHTTEEVAVDSYKMTVRKVKFNHFELLHVCESYIEIIEKQLEVRKLSPSACVLLMHQVSVWKLIKVLFSSKESTLEVDVDALIRRAEFSDWLQESVCNRVQDKISSLNDSNDLQHIFLLLTGRQLNAAVELSASRGDVRLACLLSQAGGSTLNRTDIDRQLSLWKTNGLDFNFMEQDRIRLLELLAGNIDDALGDMIIDWKRFLGLLMWYKLPPDSDLTFIFRTYRHLLEDGRAPFPVPVYIDEGLVEDGISRIRGNRFDLSYYLMLLHGSEESESSFLKTMFSAFASTHDPLDHHMIWHQRAVLEAIGTFSSDDLHVLDMGFVSQLLSLGHCHWAIYVVLHMPHRDDYPYLQANVIREILFQYCETWSAQDFQRQFIVDLGIPSAWLHEALAVYHAYSGNYFKAVEDYLGCASWQKAHSTFVTSVAHSLFLSGELSEIKRLAKSMEDHKSDIENWDFGAGIYLSFLSLRSALKSEDGTMTKLVSVKDRHEDCKKFFGYLKGSLEIWNNRLPIDARRVYVIMQKKIIDLLVGVCNYGRGDQ